MPPVPAIASIVTATAMAIFSGDIPGALLRIPGTPASAAYTDEAYAMTKKGPGGDRARRRPRLQRDRRPVRHAWCCVTSAPASPKIAVRFSSFEYFWLVLLGLPCAVFISVGDPVKGIVSLLRGLLIAAIGLDNPAGHPRFTFGVDRAARLGRPHPDDDRDVRGVGALALRGRDERRGRAFHAPASATSFAACGS